MAKTFVLTIDLDALCAGKEHPLTLLLLTFGEVAKQLLAINPDLYTTPGHYPVASDHRPVGRDDAVGYWRIARDVTIEIQPDTEDGIGHSLSLIHI